MRTQKCQPLLYHGGPYNEICAAAPTDLELSNTARILALDVGKRRIGVAISDELGLTAQGLETIERKNNREDYAILSRLASEKGAGMILVGNPVQMSGVEGRQTEWVRQFADGLAARSGLPIRLWDERLTTVEASRVLRQSGISIEKRARAVDRLSAVILLQSYLDSLRLAEETQ
jgi:putative holliday junction resolvase